MTSERGARLHPNLGTLALYSSGDLRWPARWKVGRHVDRCADCEHQVALFRSAKAELRREAKAETLTAFEAIADWTQLEREMLGNITVGVAAARCVDHVSHGHRLAWRSAFVAAMAALFVAGWVTHIPKDDIANLVARVERFAGLDRPPAVGPFLRSSPEGITVHTESATLTIMHPPSAVISLSGASAVSARYVDEETGQVTITKVYGQ